MDGQLDWGYYTLLLRIVKPIGVPTFHSHPPSLGRRRVILTRHSRNQKSKIHARIAQDFGRKILKPLHDLPRPLASLGSHIDPLVARRLADGVGGVQADLAG